MPHLEIHHISHAARVLEHDREGQTLTGGCREWPAKSLDKPAQLSGVIDRRIRRENAPSESTFASMFSNSSWRDTILSLTGSRSPLKWTRDIMMRIAGRSGRPGGVTMLAADTVD